MKNEDALASEALTPSDVAELPRPRSALRADPITQARCRWCDSTPCRCDRDYDNYLDEQMFEGREDDWLP